MNFVRDVFDVAKNWYTAATWTEKDIPDLEVSVLRNIAVVLLLNHLKV
jgi:hypothetical protein